MSLSPAVQQVVDQVLALPLHRYLGVGLVDADDPARGVRIEVGEHTANPLRVLHGGIVPTLLDVAAYLAVLPLLEPGTHAVTASTSTSLAAAVAWGSTVRFRGEVTRRGRTMAFVTATAYDVTRDRVVGTGQVVKAVLPS